MNVLEKAIIFATNAHEGQKRKISGIPYILHPLEVASIISTMTDDIEVMAAGVLHDTVEDCNVDPLEITRLFGTHVSALVQGETEDKLQDRPPSETWQERKEDSLLFIKNSKNRDIKILWLSDKLSNIRSFYREYLRIGDNLWLYLNQKDPKMQKWYYTTVADCLAELEDTPAFKEYVDLVNKIFN